MIIIIKEAGKCKFYWQTELCEIIITLSNQDFAGLDKFRLKISLGRIREMRVKLNKTKNNRNKSCVNDFLGSPFSPVMQTWLLAAVLGKVHHWHWKKEILWKVSFGGSTEKISCLQETLSLLNQCIDEENQGRLQNDKELEILGKDFKKNRWKKISLLL